MTEMYQVPVVDQNGKRVGSATVMPDMTARVYLDDEVYQKMIEGQSLVDISIAGIPKGERVADVEIALPEKPDPEAEEDPKEHVLLQTIPPRPLVQPPTNLWGHG